MATKNSPTAKTGSGSTTPVCPAPLRSRVGFALAMLLIGVAGATGGCGQRAGQAATDGTRAPRQGGRAAPSQAPISNTDACAMRLHDLCAPLLLYYRDNQSLPARLEDLRQVVGFQDQVVLTCPVSNRPYVYNPVGVVNPSQAERVIIYDAEPSHSGFRWAISIIEPKGDGPLITKVVALPESQFHFSVPR